MKAVALVVCALFIIAGGGGGGGASSTLVAGPCTGSFQVSICHDQGCTQPVAGAPVSVAFDHDVWCSSDGGTWQQLSSDVPNGAFAVLSGTVFVEGSSQSRAWSNDIVWKSANGVSWRSGYQNTLHFP